MPVAIPCSNKYTVPQHRQPLAIVAPLLRYNILVPNVIVQHEFIIFHHPPPMQIEEHNKIEAPLNSKEYILRLDDYEQELLE
eukprot:15362817-Ditylum_brightwellii.AAC.3